MASRPYYEAVPDIEHIYLEDSFVLGIHEDAYAVFFDLEAVLTEQHPLYRPPRTGEQYCYRIVRLSFSGHLNLVWQRRNFLARSTDATGEVDYGGIDVFDCLEDYYHLTGGWGEVRIRCDKMTLIFRPSL